MYFIIAYLKIYNFLNPYYHERNRALIVLSNGENSHQSLQLLTHMYYYERST